jgi:hypothetical protein
MSNGQCRFDPSTRNDKLQNDYLKVILEELRELRAEVKALDAEVKAVRKQFLLTLPTR